MYLGIGFMDLHRHTEYVEIVREVRLTTVLVNLLYTVTLLITQGINDKKTGYGISISFIISIIGLLYCVVWGLYNYCKVSSIRERQDGDVEVSIWDWDLYKSHLYEWIDKASAALRVRCCASDWTEVKFSRVCTFFSTMVFLAAYIAAIVVYLSIYTY